jgi:hypothetical protein
MPAAAAAAGREHSQHGNDDGGWKEPQHLDRA